MYHLIAKHGFWPGCLFCALLFVATRTGCESTSRNDSTAQPTRRTGAKSASPLRAPLSIPADTPARPPCHRRWLQLLNPRVIKDICQHTGAPPISTRQPNGCVFRYGRPPQTSTVVVLESPSYRKLRARFAGGPTRRMAKTWGFFHTSDRGRGDAHTVVLRSERGRALVIQAPQGICTMAQTRALALRAAQQMGRRFGSGQPVSRP